MGINKYAPSLKSNQTFKSRCSSQIEQRDNNCDPSLCAVSTHTSFCLAMITQSGTFLRGFNTIRATLIYCAALHDIALGISELLNTTTFIRDI